MKVYLVGGAVRDQLMGKDINDRDWVVVGATPDEMLTQGYTQVGKDFPVFLHPTTGEEYALARKERKVGIGYTGFACDFDTTVTLRDDLFRRDLTINAIAYDPETSEYIDPFNGMSDIKNRVLRAVSSHFAEDPLRVLRVARFAARYGYRIEPATFEMMAILVKSHEFATLSDERLFTEFRKAMSEDHAYRFVEVIHQMDGVSAVFGIDDADVVKFANNIKLLKGFTGTFEEKILVLIAGLNSADKFVEKFKLPTHMKQMIIKYQQVMELFVGVSDMVASPAVQYGTNTIIATRFEKVLRIFDVLRRKEMLEMFCKVMAVHLPNVGPFISNYLLGMAEHVIQAVRAVKIPEGMQGKDIKALMDKTFTTAVHDYVN